MDRFNSGPIYTFLVWISGFVTSVALAGMVSKAPWYNFWFYVAGIVIGLTGPWLMPAMLLYNGPVDSAPANLKSAIDWRRRKAANRTEG